MSERSTCVEDALVRVVEFADYSLNLNDRFQLRIQAGRELVLIHGQVLWHYRDHHNHI